MYKIPTSLKALGAAALLGISTVAIAAPANAQLSKVLEAVRRDSNQLKAEDQQRLREFQQQRNAQASKMAEGRSALNAAEAKGNRLSAEFNSNEAQLGELEAQVTEQAGDFQELLGQFRTAAGETMPVIRKSIANFDYKGRVEGIAEIAEARTLPDRQQLERLPKAMLQEMIAQSEVKTFTATVNGIGPEGSNAEVELMRIGVFNAATIDGTNFVEVVDVEDDVALKAYGKQPRGIYVSQMNKLINAGPDQVVRSPVDPSKGNLFAIAGELPTFNDRIGQGGPVGMVILGLLGVGLLIGLYKLFSLFMMGGAMRKTAKTKTAGDGNPLARVFETYETHKGNDIETLELKLDEQILRESPKIERFNDILKVLAAVAPLLGLLGTVIGMIITFTAITIYGAGDPKLMAGGISTALMTTVLGLVAAIPLLLLHAVVAAMSRGNQQILDEQAAGLVAEKAESSRGVVA